MLVATAGHVDHGKTSLVQQLTGVDTDRLEEEKQRGLSIELGFAFHKAGENKTIGFIDVPGHHRFLNTMISGINKIDLGMLVIAADDGPMPQTFEHLQLLRLLGVNDVAVIISKIDMASKELIEKISKQMQKIIPNATIFKISNRTGEGIQQLKQFLQQQALNTSHPLTERQFRLHVDRVFTQKGAGLIVTGTSLSGEVNLGDELKLHTFTNGNIRILKVKVRNIRAQGQAADSGQAGQRCALNLTGKISSEDIHRGDQLCASSDALSSYRLDTEFFPADENTPKLKHLGQVKLYIGTRRIRAKTYLLKVSEEDNFVAKQSTQLVQLILGEPIVAFAGDRFIIRNDNESSTLGGGIVLDPEAPKWGKSKKDRIREIGALAQHDPKLVLDTMLFTNNDFVNLIRCKRIWNLSDTELNDLLSTSPFNKKTIARVMVDNQPFIVSSNLLAQYCKQIELKLTDWHTNRPMESGIKVSQLKSLSTDEIPETYFKSVLDICIGTGKMIIKDNLVHALGHRPTISKKVQQDWLRLEKYITERGLSLPLRSEIQSETNFDASYLEELTRPELKSGQLYTIGQKRLALPATLRQLALLTLKLFETNGGFSTIDAKAAFGLGRNLTIEILEFFDAIGYTKRNGDLRIIANLDAVVGGTKLITQNNSY